MKIVIAYKDAWLKIIELRKLVLLFFFCNVLFGLLVALPFKSLLSDTVGDSLLFLQSAGKFDYTFLSDYLRTYSSGISTILQQSKWTIALFLILNVFLLGGLLQIIIKNKFSYNSDIFLLGCKSNFWRLLLLAIVFLIFHIIIWLVLFLFLRAYLHDFSPFLIDSDRQIVIGFRWLFLVGVLISAFIFLIHDIAKLVMVKQQSNIFISIKNAVRTLVKSPVNWMALLLLNAAGFFLVYLVSSLIQKYFPASNNLAIILLFLMAQLFIILRIILRFVNLAAISNFYNLVEYERT